MAKETLKRKIETKDISGATHSDIERIEGAGPFPLSYGFTFNYTQPSRERCSRTCTHTPQLQHRSTNPH